MNNINNNNNNNHNLLRTIILWVSIIALTVLAYDLTNNAQFGSGKSTFTDFIHNVEGDKVEEVIIRGDKVEGKLKTGSKFTTMVPFNYFNLYDKLITHNVSVDIVPTDSSFGTLIGVLISWFPVLLLIGVWIFFMRQMQGGAGKAMGFGKSKAKLLVDKNNKTTFKDVAGIEEAKQELEEIVEFLKFPKKFQKLGGKIPKGCLLVGSPGTGKTLLAKAIAGEAKVPFFSISGSDFVEMFVGVGASRVRDMFEQAKKQSPCIIFIDEIDAVGRHRGAGLGGGNDEREQTLNQLLVEMDGFAANEGIIVIAATNRPDVLDPALLRPGRFDRQVVVPVPDLRGREQILNVHAAKIPLASDVDLKVVARGTPGFSGADLANLMNESALLAARENKTMVTMLELDNAKDKIIMGVERKSMVMKEEERALTAYHEAGHAIVSFFSPASDPIHKATIIPRGRALGMVVRLPEEDRFSITREKLHADMAVAMGGRVAEEMIFGYDKVTTGASSDIKQATSMAKKMVTQWGMSDDIGPILVGDQKEEVFLGHSLGHDNSKSDDLASKIDSEIKRFVMLGYTTAEKLLKKHNDKLKLLAEYLLEFETLTGAEIKELIETGKLNKVKLEKVKKAEPAPKIEDEEVKPTVKRKSSIVKTKKSEE